jgi:hypothetical protein
MHTLTHTLIGIVVHLVTASNWQTPSSYVGQWKTMLFPNTTILPASGVEDPHVYLDGNGIVHAVFHNQIEVRVVLVDQRVVL